MVKCVESITCKQSCLFCLYIYIYIYIYQVKEYNKEVIGGCHNCRQYTKVRFVVLSSILNFLSTVSNNSIFLLAIAVCVSVFV